jgi:hypothetical protein
MATLEYRVPIMKVLNPLKTAFGKGKFSRLKDVSYHQWEDAFAVEFDDGLCFLEPHQISPLPLSAAGERYRQF